MTLGVTDLHKLVTDSKGMFFGREDIQLDLMEFEEEGNEVRTKWKFSALLQLPWRPRLAAAGGTQHVLDKVASSVHNITLLLG
jgi:hypothetical protein